MSRLFLEEIEKFEDRSVKDKVLKERLNCSLCGSSEYSIFIDFPDIPICKCRYCGFIYSGYYLIPIRYQELMIAR
jgi:hypothetical protein